jgi:hypothetical protein
MWASSYILSVLSFATRYGRTRQVQDLPLNPEIVTMVCLVENKGWEIDA